MKPTIVIRSTLLATTLALTTLGCPDDAPGRGDADTATDTPDAPDSASDTIDDPDTGDATDATDTADTALDTADTADTAPDSLPSDVTVATPGERCSLAERVGLVEIEEIPAEPTTFYAFAGIDDRPNPWYGAPELSSGGCDFHRFDPTSGCPPCAVDELCGIDGTCNKAPTRHLDATLTLTAEDTTQTFAADPVTGDMWGQLTLAGRAFAVEVTFAGQRVTLPLTESPGALDEPHGTLEGGYEAPTRLDLAWQTAAAGTHVFTRIPINHHAAGPTFTECTVPARTGALTIGEAMLAPLAIITGLEFQGLEHIRFAAAHTPLGCVEIRFTMRQYVSF